MPAEYEAKTIKVYGVFDDDTLSKSTNYSGSLFF